jgi:hypothetical protein
MKHVLSLLAATLLATTLQASTPLLDRLRQLPRLITNITPCPTLPYAETYTFTYRQPVDHADTTAGHFLQRVILSHRHFDAPVVAILEGYALGEPRESELSQLLSANQITIEHRFFDASAPPGEIPWKHLTIANAAADHHQIIQTLRRRVYPATPWITTGISKGGQTTIFHRYFYPDDVEVSVPYVAPFNLEYVDPRLKKHLARLGETPAQKQKEGVFRSGGKENTLKLLQFQHACLQRLDRLAPLLEEYAGDNAMTFARAGGVQRALKLLVLEYPFAFWQWNGNVGDIPEPELENDYDLFRALVEVSPPDFFSDQGIDRILPFYYAALTEIGMYDYDLTPFRPYFKQEPDRRRVDFRFTIPDDIPLPPFNDKQARQINHWLQTDARRMLFIYGGLDPWAGTAVDLKTNDKCKLYIKADANHTCRIASFERLVRDDILQTLLSWIAPSPSPTPSPPPTPLE